jgi:hypothetical protein
MTLSFATAAVPRAAQLVRDARVLLVCSRPGTSAGANDDLLANLDGELAARLDIERHSPPEAARRLRTWVSATQPTLLLVRDGSVVAVAVGALSRLELERLIRHAIL